MTTVNAGPLSGFTPNTAHRLHHDGLDLVLIRDADDVYAIEDVCSHAEVALSEGEVRGCHIECWMHGSAFDVRTGMPDAPPAVSAVRTFPVSISDQNGTPTVFVEIG